MKILIAGDWHSKIHEQACHDALKSIGHEVHAFKWFEYFGGYKYHDMHPAKTLLLKAQNKLIAGPLIKKINRELVQKVKRIDPDVLLVYRGTHINKETLFEIKTYSDRIFLVSYNNDDPFSKKASGLLWRHFKRSLSYYDMNFVYRDHNIEDYTAAGARNIHLLRSYYIPGRNHFVELDNEDAKKFQCDVVFAGHYENDGREKYVEEIVKNKIDFKLFGPEWNNVVKKSGYLKKYHPVRMVLDNEYNKALCGSKIALAFLSKLNRDTYTRRCFEIPATKTFMLSEYSDDLACLFEEGVEAEFFRSKKELVEKIHYYLKNPDKRTLIAEKGFERIVKDGHDVISRMKQAVDLINRVS